jgi:hypothetical protein
MSKFFDSLKSDLLDRRLLPLVALVAVGLLAAIAYAVLAGSGSSTPVTASAPATTPASGIVVSAVSTTGEAGAGETTSGAKQSAGPGRDPFQALPEPKTSSSSSAPAPSSSSSSPGTSTTPAGSTTGSSSTGGESSSGSSTPPSSETAPVKPKPKKQPQTTYNADVLFGATAAGTPALSAQLQAFNALKLQQPLPDDKDALVVFRGVIAGGKSATFTLVGEAILRGEATCLPSTAQCQAIELKEGQTEELEETPPGGTPVVYELYLLGIKTNTSSTSSEGATVRESKAGLKLLREAGLQALPGLRYSRSKSMLVFASHRAFAARAHVSSMRAAAARRATAHAAPSR